MASVWSKSTAYILCNLLTVSRLKKQPVYVGHPRFYSATRSFLEIPASLVPRTPPGNSPAKPETRQMASIMASAWNRSSAKSRVSVS